MMGTPKYLVIRTWCFFAMARAFIYLSMRKLVTDPLMKVFNFFNFYQLLLFSYHFLKYPGAGFASQDLYLHGFFSASIKLPSYYAAGVVVAFYVSFFFVDCFCIGTSFHLWLYLGLFFVAIEWGCVQENPRWVGFRVLRQCERKRMEASNQCLWQWKYSGWKRREIRFLVWSNRWFPSILHPLDSSSHNVKSHTFWFTFSLFGNSNLIENGG